MTHSVWNNVPSVCLAGFLKYLHCFKFLSEMFLLKQYPVASYKLIFRITVVTSVKTCGCQLLINMNCSLK